ncbi:DUF7310 family coiled-coil domain-containing protein [Salinigranum salinum]|uniref:DUF7310 family coiled-coil domain-containing protein n=1 Tax=Salinigranum salinum TaxID=1364937 RepID=UPI0012604DA5|nr:hypothetical protein [Salinigranum salinum]
MTDDLTRRLEAVERAVTDGHTDLAGVADDAAVADRLAAVERRLDDVETRLDDLDATTQALRGYLGGVDGVTEDVERRADLALAKAEAIEAAVFDDDDGLAVERLDAGRQRPAIDTDDDEDSSTDPTGSREPTDSAGGSGPIDSETARSPVDRLRDVL